jgi:hypothetical protein
MHRTAEAQVHCIRARPPPVFDGEFKIVHPSSGLESRSSRRSNSRVHLVRNTRLPCHFRDTLAAITSGDVLIDHTLWLSTEGLVLRKSRASVNAFRCFFAEGEIGGSPCMRSHIFIHLATIISSAKPFIFKIKIEKEGLPRDSPAALGARLSTPTTPSVSSNH